MSARYLALAALLALAGTHHAAAVPPAEHAAQPDPRPPPVTLQEGYYLSRAGRSTCVVRVQLQEGGAHQLTWASAQPYHGLGVLHGETLVVGLLMSGREAVAVYTFDRTLPGWRGEWSAWNVEAKGAETLEWLRGLR